MPENTTKPWQWWVEKVIMPLVLALISAIVLLITTGVIKLSARGNEEVQPIIGTWQGTTTGTKAGEPIAERVTTVSIPEDCQPGRSCGYTSLSESCDYQLTLTEASGDKFKFDAEVVTGPEFCEGERLQQTIELTLVSEKEIKYYYLGTYEDGTVVTRVGTLTRK